MISISATGPALLAAILLGLATAALLVATGRTGRDAVTYGLLVTMLTYALLVVYGSAFAYGSAVAA